MPTIYVLIMLWSTSSSYGGVSFIQQEFTTLERCEAVRQELAKARDGNNRVLAAQGCFKK